MSYFVLADGDAFVELAPCRDYKRVGDGDLGPNTGGMGTFSPAPGLDGPSRERLLDTVVRPTIRGLASEGRAFQGVLFIGLMLTESGPKVLEYNARFGDPETQVLVPRLDGDWLPLLLACAEGRLGRQPAPGFREDAAVCVVMASGGYPGAYTKGHAIRGIEAAEAIPGVVVFHAGTELDASGRLVTAGGRVLGVTATGRDLRAARETAYRAVGEIHWDDEHHRGDIALPVSAVQDRDGA
jgi:phosphoribosylamine--glycine ligase